MFSGAKTQNPPSLISVMLDMKELLYYSILKPAEFAEWVNTYASDNDRAILAAFSTEFKKIALPDGALHELEIEKKHYEIFKTRKIFGELWNRLYREFGSASRFMPTDDKLTPNQRAATDNWSKWFALSCNVHRSEEFLSKKGLNDLIVLTEKMVSYLNDLLNQDNTGYADLVSLINSIGVPLKTLLQQTEDVERNAHDLDTLNNYKTAIAKLMDADDTGRLQLFLSSQPNWTTFLCHNIFNLLPLSTKFKDYLNKNGKKPSNLLSSSSSFFSSRGAAERDYHDSVGNRETLRQYVSFAKKFSYQGLLKAGEMIMNGKGCLSNPELACLYLQAAVVFAENEEQKGKAVSLFSRAYEYLLNIKDQKINPAEYDLDDLAGEYLAGESGKESVDVASFRPVFKTLIPCISGLENKQAQARQWLRLGETYFEIYSLTCKVTGRYDTTLDPNLEKACEYIEKAHESAKHCADELNKLYVKEFGLKIEDDAKNSAAELFLALLTVGGLVDEDMHNEMLQQQDKYKRDYAAAKELQKEIETFVSEQLSILLQNTDAIGSQNLTRWLGLELKVNPLACLDTPPPVHKRLF